MRREDFHLVHALVSVMVLYAGVCISLPTPGDADRCDHCTRYLLGVCGAGFCLDKGEPGSCWYECLCPGMKTGVNCEDDGLLPNVPVIREKQFARVNPIDTLQLGLFQQHIFDPSFSQNDSPQQPTTTTTTSTTTTYPTSSTTTTPTSTISTSSTTTDSSQSQDSSEVVDSGERSTDSTGSTTESETNEKHRRSSRDFVGSLPVFNSPGLRSPSGLTNPQKASETGSESSMVFTNSQQLTSLTAAKVSQDDSAVPGSTTTSTPSKDEVDSTPLLNTARHRSTASSVLNGSDTDSLDSNGERISSSDDVALQNDPRVPATHQQGSSASDSSGSPAAPGTTSAHIPSMSEALDLLSTTPPSQSASQGDQSTLVKLIKNLQRQHRSDQPAPSSTSSTTQPSAQSHLHSTQEASDESAASQVSLQSSADNTRSSSSTPPLTRL